jgi:hypothetical protein
MPRSLRPSPQAPSRLLACRCANRPNSLRVHIGEDGSIVLSKTVSSPRRRVNRMRDGTACACPVITHKHRKGCASRRVISRGWYSTGLGRFSPPGLRSLTRSHRSILRRTRLMPPCAMHPSFQSDGSPRRPSRCEASSGILSSKITVASDRIEIRLSRANVAAALDAGGRSQRPDLDPVVLSIEAKLRRAGKGKRLVIENGAEAEVNADLVELIKDAFTIRIQLLSGSDDSIEAMSGHLAMNKCRLTSLIRLSYLAPDIVRALLEGRQPNRAHADTTLATEQGPAARLERTAPFPRLRRLNLHQTPGETLHIRRLETASRDPVAVRAPHPGVWRLWLSPMRSPER